MGLTMSERKAVTKKLALEYQRSDKARKGELLNQVCALNGWHRSHARKRNIRCDAEPAKVAVQGCVDPINCDPPGLGLRRRRELPGRHR